MSRQRRSAALFAAIAIAAFPVAASAQSAGRGFLFGAPDGSFTLRGGWAMPTARSDLFAFTTDQLTLGRGDFGSPALEAEVAGRIFSRTDIVFTAGLSGMDKGSEFRYYIDNNDKPIEQTTNFMRVPLTAGVRQYLTAPGRSVGQFAWIPARVAPYIGAGAGVMYYRFRQRGDFIDLNTLDVFPSLYESDGWTGTAYATAGLDYSLGPRFVLNGEARYLWSKAALSHDFSGFEHLDLSGLSTMVGISVRF